MERPRVRSPLAPEMIDVRDEPPATTDAAGTGPRPEMRVPKSRTGAVFTSAVLGLLLLLAVLVFVLQNSERQHYEFLWGDFTLPAGVAMLLAAVAGGLIVSLIGLARMLQMRLAARRHRHADRNLG